MKKFLTIFASFIFLSLILPNNLEFTDIQIQANQSGVIELSLDNPQDQIAGIQFQIVDYPNHGLFTAIDPSDRLDGFMVEFYEQEDGSVIVVGFSLTGGVIGTGSGPILSLTYQSTNQYSSEIELSLIEEASFLGDALGNALAYTYSPGMITVIGEEPPEIQTVEKEITGAVQVLPSGVQVWTPIQPHQIKQPLLKVPLPKHPILGLILAIFGHAFWNGSSIAIGYWSESRGMGLAAQVILQLGWICLLVAGVLLLGRGLMASIRDAPDGSNLDHYQAILHSATIDK